MAQKFTDNAATLLFSGISASDTTLTVSAGTGDNFPAVSGTTSDFFVITMEDSSGNTELIKVDHRPAASDVMGNGTYPCTRGYGGTTARVWSASDIVDLRWHAYAIEQFLTDAETAVTAAETAQTAAETALDTFDDRFLGSKTSDPTLDNDGDPLVEGTIYWNSTDNRMRIYDGTSWVTVSSPSTIEVTEITATAGQTAFTTHFYTAGYTLVMLNGVVLDSADYTETDSTTITLTSGADEDDSFKFVSWESITTANIATKADKVVGATSGNFAELDANGNLVDSGFATTDKADKVSGATSGNIAELDGTGNLVDSGAATTSKADKVIPAAAGNFAGLNATGNLTDSGASPTDLNNKAEKVTGATENNFASLTATGDLQDSGSKAADFATAAHTHTGVYQPYDANLPTWPSTVDATEVGYLDGVTSAIQTQIDNAGAWTLIDAWTPTAVNSKDWTWEDADYSQIKIVLSGVAPATDGVVLRMRFGHTDGATFYSGTDDYTTVTNYHASLDVADSLTYIELCARNSADAFATQTIGSATGEGINYEITINGVGTTVGFVSAKWAGAVSTTTGTAINLEGRGHLKDTTADTTSIDSVRLYWSAGNFDTVGKVYVYGLKTS